jgi:hypothetical protein
MPLDEMLLQKIRESSRELWCGVRHRMGLRALLLVLLAYGCFWAVPWFWGETWQAGGLLPTAAAIGRPLLPIVALLAAFAMALLDSLRVLIVSGPLLRSLGDLALIADLRPAGPDMAAQFAAFASPQRLARAARIRDLPLILFLARIVLRVDVAPLLHVAKAGLAREALVREVERQARDRAAAILRRLKALLWIGCGILFAIPLLVGWALR